MKELKIEIPEGYRIDEENSSFELIKFIKIPEPKFKKGDWVTWIGENPHTGQVVGKCLSYAYCWDLGNENNNSCHEDLLRLATQEEINAQFKKGVIVELINNEGLIESISSKAVISNTETGDNCFILEGNTIHPFTKIGPYSSAHRYRPGA